jgi:hypothetical protein
VWSLPTRTGRREPRSPELQTPRRLASSKRASRTPSVETTVASLPAVARLDHIRAFRAPVHKDLSAQPSDHVTPELVDANGPSGSFNTYEAGSRGHEQKSLVQGRPTSLPYTRQPRTARNASATSSGPQSGTDSPDRPAQALGRSSMSPRTRPSTNSVYRGCSGKSLRRRTHHLPRRIAAAGK